MMMSSAGLTVETHGGGVHFSDRSAGNMSSVGGAEHEHGAENRVRLRERLGLRRLARGYQVHGTHVQSVAVMPADEAEVGELEHADGQSTAVPALGTMVLTGDCLPVALMGGGAVAMLHAGWRGLAGGVIESGVRAVEQLGGGEVVAVLGPCAGPCCYEVGPEVHAALGTGVGEKALIDLRDIAQARLVEAGVGSVVRLGGCTICDERFFSHRREGERAGRQAGVAWLS
jgi:polyphenol oxidase